MPQTFEYPPLLPSVVCDGRRAKGSNWRLARTLSRAGQIGVISLASIDRVLIERLEAGDIGGAIRWALDEMPVADLGARIKQRYFFPFGTNVAARRKRSPTRVNATTAIAAGAFAEVYLAKHGHSGVIGIAWPSAGASFDLPALYGAMLARVDCVLAPLCAAECVATVIDQLACGEVEELPLPTDGSPLHRPGVLVVDSTSPLAVSLSRRLEESPADSVR